MSEKSNKNKAYTLTMESVYEILSDAQDTGELSKDLLLTFLDMDLPNEYICFLLSEVYWTSYSSVRILEREIDTAVLTEDKQFLIAEDSLNILQSLMLSKHAAITELRSLSISIEKN